jgi:hypothetical protein
MRPSREQNKVNALVLALRRHEAEKARRRVRLLKRAKDKAAVA